MTQRSLMAQSTSQDHIWIWVCEGCGEPAALEQRDWERSKAVPELVEHIHPGGIRHRARWTEVVRRDDYDALLKAARVYVREFDHLIGDEKYPERTALRELLDRLDPRAKPPENMDLMGQRWDPIPTPDDENEVWVVTRETEYGSHIESIWPSLEHARDETNRLVGGYGWTGATVSYARHAVSSPRVSS